MLEILVVIVFVALAGSSIFQYLYNRNTKRELQEYKALFETADGLHKAAEVALREVLQSSGEQSVVVERSCAALETANDQIKEQQEVLSEYVETITALKAALEFQEGQYTTLLSQKKSSEVRTGKITEQISPFLADYPLDSATARFIGDPIDFVHFDADKVTFVEVKSGKSQLSKKQRMIRDLIKTGKVEFTIYRVEGK
jgi:predicted Holliday junction resolvase-like endonuclease